jgi:hypothetical protein
MAPQTTISVPPWAILGYRADGRPIRPLAGGAEDTDPEPEPDDKPEPDDGPDPSDWTPPTREEWEAHQEKLRKASGEAAARRKFLREHGIDPKTGTKLQPDPEPEPEPEPRGKDDEPRGPSAAEVRRQVEKAAAEAELRGMRKTKALVTGLNGALADAGWNGSRLGSLMKLLDLDDVDIDDDGEITGLSEQIAEIKAEWPEFFKRQRSTSAGSVAGSGQNGAPAAKVDTADKPAPKPEPKGWAETLAQRAIRG